jgi:hypothetical protein
MKQKKRRSLYSFRGERKLLDLITARLLPPRPQGVRPDDEWDQRHRELTIRVMLCLYEGEEETESEQVEEIIEGIDEEVRAALVASFNTWAQGLDHGKRLYIVQELNRRFPWRASPNPERDRPGAIMAIRRIKDFLRKNGLAPGEADQLIGEALGKTVGTLQQTLQRAK